METIEIIDYDHQGRGIGKLNNKTVIHVVVGFNGDRVIIISAYYPDLEHWESDYRTRKRRE